MVHGLRIWSHILNDRTFNAFFWMNKPDRWNSAPPRQHLQTDIHFPYIHPHIQKLRCLVFSGVPNHHWGRIIRKLPASPRCLPPTTISSWPTPNVAVAGRGLHVEPPKRVGHSWSFKRQRSFWDEWKHGQTWCMSVIWMLNSWCDDTSLVHSSTPFWIQSSPVSRSRVMISCQVAWRKWIHSSTSSTRYTCIILESTQVVNSA